MSIPREVYHNELRKLGHGYPIYEPDPSDRYDMVRVGDVGFVRSGFFHRIFNVFKERTDNINQQYGVPRDFAPLQGSLSETHSLAPLPAGPIISTYVRTNGANFGATSSCIPANATIKFSISNQQGAALLIKHRAKRKDIFRDRPLKEYMLRNYRSWLDFIRDDVGCDISLEDMILVTGCDLTADWATVIFTERTVEYETEFRAADPSGLVSGSAGLWGSWHSSINVPHRCGPSLIESDHAIIHRHENSRTEDPNFNQCIFLRGFRVRERRPLPPKIIKAAAEPRDLDMDKDDEFMPAVPCSEIDFDPGECDSEPGSSICNAIFDYIFEETNSEVSIIHDNDICRIIGDIDWDTSSRPSPDILREKGLRVQADFNESLQLNVGGIASVNLTDKGHRDARHADQPSSFEFVLSDAPDGNSFGKGDADTSVGSGKTIGRLLDIVGHHIDHSLTKAAERLGYGPRVTTERIRQRIQLIKHAFMRYEGRECCECRGDKTEILGSPELIKFIKEETGRLMRDVKRLLKYVNSNVPITQKQALDTILDLSVDHRDVRTFFKDMGAINTITDVMQVYSTFRSGDGYSDNLLLSSSRKALVSLRDSEINTLLQQWSSLLRSRPVDYKRVIQLWLKIAPYLRDTDIAFLIMRVLNRSERWSTNDSLVKEITGSIASCMKSAPSYFEWKECERTSEIIYNGFGQYKHDARSIARDYVLWFTGGWPRVLESKLFQRLSKSVSKISRIEHLEFVKVHILKASLMRILDHDGEDSKLPDHLKAFRIVFRFPVERAVCEFTWSNSHYWCDEVKFTNGISLTLASYVDSIDPEEREKAWDYCNYFLDWDLGRCDSMLDALSNTAFAASIDFPAFKTSKRQSLPSTTLAGETDLSLGLRKGEEHALREECREKYPNDYRHDYETGNSACLDSSLHGPSSSKRRKASKDDDDLKNGPSQRSWKKIGRKSGRGSNEV